MAISHLLISVYIPIITVGPSLSYLYHIHPLTLKKYANKKFADGSYFKNEVNVYNTPCPLHVLLGRYDVTHMCSGENPHTCFLEKHMNILWGNILHTSGEDTYTQSEGDPYTLFGENTHDLGKTPIHVLGKTHKHILGNHITYFRGRHIYILWGKHIHMIWGKHT
jgi:hypothetical protein